VGVDQHHAVTLVAQGLAGLGAGIVELAGLADDDRAGADDENGFEVSALGHLRTRMCVRRSAGKRWSARRRSAPASKGPPDHSGGPVRHQPRAAVISAMKRSNSNPTSCGPGEASGCPWKENAGASVNSMPWMVWSNSERWVMRTLAG